MNEPIHLSLTQLELDALEAAITDSRNRGILLSPAAAIRSFMWIGIHTFRGQCAKSEPQNEAVIREIEVRR